MSDTHILDIPSEIDPVEEADIVINAYRVCKEGGLVISDEEQFLLAKFISLREFIREEMGY